VEFAACYAAFATRLGPADSFTVSRQRSGPATSARRESSGLWRSDCSGPAHVLAWAGFVDFLDDKLVAGHLPALQAGCPNWGINASEDLRDWGE
jgi:hypothetical protein